ncbi:MAG TPA: immunoglobulin domain-containing protein, partial [Verrucomicrobiae bacterium]
GTNIVETFDGTTFSEVNGVNQDMAIGTFTYRKTGAVNGSLSLKYTGPPSQAFSSNNVSATLVFTATDSGNFTTNGASAPFVLTTADTLAPVALPDAIISFNNNDGTNITSLMFLLGPDVVDNGNIMSVANPLVVSLDAQYPGQTGDRVRLTFVHEQFINGAWQQVGLPNFTGTVVNIGDNAVTINFDSSTFLSKTDTYFPLTNNPVNILSVYNVSGGLITNAGTFTFTNVSPAGALLTLSQTGTNQNLVLTFTNDSSSGIFYQETYSVPGNVLAGKSSGFFDIALPAFVITSPQTTGVTNGGTANFRVVAGGTPPLMFQWQFSATGTNGWTDLADVTNVWGSVVTGSTTTNLTIANVATNDYGNYQVVVTNQVINYGSVTSRVAQLTQ